MIRFVFVLEREIAVKHGSLSLPSLMLCGITEKKVFLYLCSFCFVLSALSVDERKSKPRKTMNKDGQQRRNVIP